MTFAVNTMLVNQSLPQGCGCLRSSFPSPAEHSLMFDSSRHLQGWETSVPVALLSAQIRFVATLSACAPAFTRRKKTYAPAITRRKKHMLLRLLVAKNIAERS